MTRAARIIIVEDEPTLLETLEFNLTRQGLPVETAGDGQAALQTTRLNRPDMIVLDVMLPELDGFDVCRILRQEMSVPILFLTARDDETDRVVGLELGADDYLTKPFSMRELIARVKALLRRVKLDQGSFRFPPAAGKPSLTFENPQLNPARHEVTLSGKPLALKPKEDVHIRWLREKIEAVPVKPTRIITVRGAGYCFEG